MIYRSTFRCAQRPIIEGGANSLQIVSAKKVSRELWPSAEDASAEKTIPASFLCSLADRDGVLQPQPVLYSRIDRVAVQCLLRHAEDLLDIHELCAEMAVHGERDVCEVSILMRAAFDSSFDTGRNSG